MCCEEGGSELGAGWEEHAWEGPGGGGGAAGFNGNGDGQAGTVNTGGGGGGGISIGTNNFGGAGGSGIVIIAYANTFPAATLTNLTYTEPTRSGYRVYQITASSSGTITFNV